MQTISAKMLTFKKPTAREVKISAAMLGTSIILFTGAWIFLNGSAPNASTIANLTEKKVAVAESSALLPTAKVQPYSLKQQTNPFSSLSPSTKVGSLPPVPAVPSLPVNMAAMRKPEISDATTGRKGLHVTSVFLGKAGKNMAVLSDGKVQVTAREGKSNKFGYVSEITREGVYLDGRLIEVSKEVIETPVAVVSPVVQPPVPVETYPAVPPAAVPPTDNKQSAKNETGRK